jgi:DNA-binding SARP family transcriptional activator/ABC-type branched-subunit amino acid transport system substrate-binding protein/streptogramin lyase
MRYGILGQLEVRDGTRTVPVANGRQRLLMSVLLMHADEPVSSDRLIDALWGEMPPATAASSLHNLVSALRKAIGDGRLLTEGHGYRLHLDGDDLDARRFDDLSAQGRAALDAGQPERAADVLREALALWRGPPFGDLAYEAALQADAASLQERRLAALEDRVDADLALGRDNALVAELERLVATHPLRERLRGQQMLALYRCGRQADALAAYADARRHLVEQLGIEPGPALRSLEQAVLEQNPALGTPDPLPPPPRQPSSRSGAPPPPPLARLRRHPVALAVAGALMLAAALAGVLLAGADSPDAGRAALVGNALVAVDPHTGRVVAEVPIGRTPTSVAVGAGAVWALNADDQTIARFDPRTKRLRIFGLGATATDLAAGAGALWVGSGRGSAEGPTGTGRLLRVDGDGALVRARIELPAGRHQGATGQPGQIAVGGGSLWAINDGEDLVRVDPGTGRVRGTVRSLRARAVAAADGSVWALASDDATVVQVDARTAAVRRRVRIPAARLDAIAAGAGAVWAADAYDGTLWRIDPGPKVVTRTIPVGVGVTGVTVGAGAVWVINSLRGTLVRVDPRSNRATQTVTVGSTPRDVEFGAGAVWVSLAGGPEPVEAGAAGSAGGPRPLPRSACGPVFTGASAPDYLIASDVPLQAGREAGTLPMANAVAFVLRQHGFRAGRYRIGYQSCDASTATSGQSDPAAKCEANAKAYAATPGLLGVVGPYNSVCAEVEIPILNRAPGGPVALISPSNSMVGLTHRDPLAPRDALARMYPTGARNYARVSAAFDAEAAADAVLARELGLRRVYVLDDGLDPGRELALHFRRAARALGLRVAGSARWDPRGTGFTALAEGVRRVRADGVFLGGLVGSSGGPLTRALRARLGPRVTLIAANPFGPVDFLYRESRGAAKGMYISTPGLPTQRVGERGRRFLRDFAPSQAGLPFDGNTVRAAAATEVLLDAIARSDGTRASVARQLIATQLKDSIIGPLRFDRNGDLTASPVTIMRVRRRDGVSGVQFFEGAAIDRVLVAPRHAIG